MDNLPIDRLLGIAELITAVIVILAIIVAIGIGIDCIRNHCSRCGRANTRGRDIIDNLM